MEKSGNEELLKWVPTRNGEIANGSIQGGYDLNGDPYYIGRAEAESGYIVPGEIVPKKNGCVIIHNGEVVVKENYEVYVQTPLHGWVSSGKDQGIPKGAIEGGKTADGKELYIGRTNNVGKGTHVGYVGPEGELHVEVGGKEHAFDNYLVLVDLRKRE